MKASFNDGRGLQLTGIEIAVYVTEGSDSFKAC